MSLLEERTERSHMSLNDDSISDKIARGPGCPPAAGFELRPP